MSFFKAFFKTKSPAPNPPEATPQKPPEPVEKQDIPELYTGMKVEVLSPHNNLLFVGVLNIHDGILEVHPENDGLLPLADYQQAIKLRGFQKNSQAFTLNGSVGQSSAEFWRIENLKFLQSKDSRAFFRQNANVKAEILPKTHYKGQEKMPCKILDISAGGARVLGSPGFQDGDLFILEVSLISEDESFSMTCQVRHAAEVGRDMEYGCQFVGLPEKEQERLLQTIFALQRKILQSRRD